MPQSTHNKDKMLTTKSVLQRLLMASTMLSRVNNLFFPEFLEAKFPINSSTNSKSM